MTFSNIFSPFRLAILLAVLFALWLIIGDQKTAQDQPPKEQTAISDTLAKVEVTLSNAIDWPHEIVVQGQVEPWQAVTVTAQVAGQVDTLLAAEGQAVGKDEGLLQLSDEGRAQRLVQAKAALHLAQQELKSSRTLESTRLVAETELSRLQSVLEQARANMEAAQLAVDFGIPKAPFTGVVNQRLVDQGEFVRAGDPLMEVVDIERLKVIAQIPQQQVASLVKGQKVEIRLLDGRLLSGEIRFVSYAAAASTRSFYIEVAAPNPEHLRIAGASATLRIQLPATKVHRVSPALLSLNDVGKLGVHAVDKDNKVQFYPVEVVDIDEQGASLLGLPDTFKLITLGAGFVEPGQQVQPVEASQ